MPARPNDDPRYASTFMEPDDVPPPRAAVPVKAARRLPEMGILVSTSETANPPPPPPRPSPKPGPEPTPAPVDQVPPAPVVPPFRPTVRPPVAMLILCDDGSRDGEVIRLRADRYTVGRDEGEIRIPHDERVSARHLEITRVKVDYQWKWIVTDLESTNGLFIRVSRTALAPGDEVLVGRGRYRFEAPEPPRPAPATAPGTGRTVGWMDEVGTEHPVFVEQLNGGSGLRLQLVSGEYWIGSEPSCAIARQTDPFIDARHAKLIRRPDGRWQIENNKSVNGIFYRVPHVVCTNGCVFQIGEQRMRLEVPR